MNIQIKHVKVADNFFHMRSPLKHTNRTYLGKLEIATKQLRIRPEQMEVISDIPLKIGHKEVASEVILKVVRTVWDIS